MDSRLKYLKFVSDDTIKFQTIEKLRDLYFDEQLANEFDPLDSTRNTNIRQSTTTSLLSNSIITALLMMILMIIVENNEVDAYLNLQISKKCNPLN